MLDFLTDIYVTHGNAYNITNNFYQIFNSYNKETIRRIL